MFSLMVGLRTAPVDRKVRAATLQALLTACLCAAAPATLPAQTTAPAGSTQEATTWSGRREHPFSEPAATRTPIDRSSAPATGRHTSSGASLLGTLTVLGGVVLLILVSSRWLGRSGAGGRGRLPTTAVQWLGSTPLSPQQSIHLVRIGERILVLGSGSDGLRTLSEITDPSEQTHLIHLCHADAAPRSGEPRWRNWLNRGRDLSPGAARSLPGDPAGNLSDAHRIDRRQDVTPPASRGGRPATAPIVGRAVRAGLLVIGLAMLNGAAQAQEFIPPAGGSPGFPSPIASSTDRGPLPTESAAATTPLETSSWLAPRGLSGTLHLGLLVGVMSLAPAILLMTTCYVRIIVVLGLLRQALGVAQFPPTQVLTALSLFLTALIMWPVWTRSYEQGIVPYSQRGVSDSAAAQAALTATLQPIREFMSRQIEATGNTAAIDLFLEYQSESSAGPQLRPEYYEDVPLQVLLPAYVLSELKAAFLLGFRIYLPFVVIDLVTASVLAALGLQLLSPAVVSLPFKLLLFVLIDGWFLTVELLLRSLAPLN